MACRHRLAGKATRKAVKYGVKGAKAAAHATLLVGFWSVLGPAILYSMFTYDPNERPRDY